MRFSVLADLVLQWLVNNHGSYALVNPSGIAELQGANLSFAWNIELLYVAIEVVSQFFVNLPSKATYRDHPCNFL